MLAEFADAVVTVFTLIVLLFWPGFVIQHVLVRSEDALEIVIFSTGFGLAFLVLICPVLDLVWDVSFLPLVCSVLLLSGILFFKRKRPQKMIIPHKWEILLLILIFVYGFMLRSYTLFDILPEGQDAWRHFSFMHYTHQLHALPQVIPWAAPERPVTIMMYPPGSHCIGALFSYFLPGVSFAATKAVFIAIGTGSALSSYVVFKSLIGRKEALLSTFLIAGFVPHMIMTTEVTAEAVAIFLYPLICYFFYTKKVAACSILLGAVILIHHLTAFGVVVPLLTFSLFCAILKKWEYLLSFLGISVISLGVSAPWWSLRSFILVWAGPEIAADVLPEVFFHPYTDMVSPLFVILSMVGFFIILRNRMEKKSRLEKEKKEGDKKANNKEGRKKMKTKKIDIKQVSLFLIIWGVALFVTSQPILPLRFSSHRFLAFFVFPCSVFASVGLLHLRTLLRKVFFVGILLLFCAVSPPHFWPTTGEQNLYATEWVRDSTLDSVFYVYSPHYTFVYPLSNRKIYEITDFDNPFDYEGHSTYFYNDAAWVPHDVTKFGRFDRLYSCSGVDIIRIE